MSTVAASIRVDRSSPPFGLTPTPHICPASASGLDPSLLMARGDGLAIPRLAGVPIRQQLWRGERTAARVALTMFEAGVADSSAWPECQGSPFELIRRSIERWVKRHSKSPVGQQFYLDVSVSSQLDHFRRGDDQTDSARLFLTVEPESAGYIVLGPTLRLLEALHPRLPVTFALMFLGSLNRWVRVYDYRDAQDRTERLRDWYESDPDAGEVELPDISRFIPVSMEQRHLSVRALTKLIPEISDPDVARMLRLLLRLERASRYPRPTLGEEFRDELIDFGEPLPALLAVFERHDPIEGSFDEESQGMLEVTPEPNLIIPFQGDSAANVASAFAALAALCRVVATASELMTLLPGNEHQV